MKTVKRLLGLLFAVVLTAGTLQGTVYASQKESTRTDAAAVFGNKVKELEKKYGVLKEGRETFRIDTKEYFTVWNRLLRQRKTEECFLPVFTIMILTARMNS